MSYYIAPQFLDKLSIHITKNYLDLPGVRVPLILGIHGRKGEGKSFQCDLAFQRMGVEAVHMSAGEMESPDAGDPARLIRLRYREAAELCRVRGRMTVLMINDLDAGAGRVDQFTQYTVNTQLVNGTLMNIADNPTNVQLPGSYEIEPIQRVPIVVTGNDFSTLYAPLIRDGRMEKFFWEPNRDDRIGIVGGIFEQDAIARDDITKLVDTFPNQAIDFYSALRSRLYDELVRQFIADVGIEKVSARVVNSPDRLPDFRKPDFGLSHLIELGKKMVAEQDRVREMRLSQEYNEVLHRSNRRLGEVNLAAQQMAREESAPANPAVAGNGQTRHATQENRPYSTQPANDERNRNGQPTDLNQETAKTLKDLLNQGYRVGLEYVNERRFRTNSWQSYAVVQGNPREAIATLEACLADHDNDYVRLVGIEPNARRRVVETIVHRPTVKR
ncbi:ribulose bisphosphate carboxylase small subunit [Oculatella sp. LEGE 06141]|uniref:ribulose bisphosphate carboxylase small subunit n=1 Tax=Oculatella sp. LEGE 06141 TaxID=1828648 RepID=UPI001882257F|nr:ribulose bisphosphate carboxylase small subunit [Oculatella sp. LEGE 06141]MBE9180648.1 ribulose bisphosphate carboxylase small subunit [Oculatella sp. LEGE 06141]